MGNKCESCLMPFSQDPGNRENDQYCSYCFADGKFTFVGELKDFQNVCYKAMVDHGMNKFKAKFFAFCIRFAPRWKKK